MSKIYLPTEYVNSSCKVINNGYIRVYDNNTYNSWVDIYVNQDYMIKPGSSNYSNQPVCDTYNTYTDNFYYRTDFSDICVMFAIFVVFIIFIPIKIVSKLFIRGGL